MPQKLVSFNLEYLHQCLTKNEATLVGYNQDKLTRNVIISFKCKCGMEREKVFREISRTGAKCKNCQRLQANIIRNKTNQTKYGCDNPMQNINVQAKTKQTNINKYGVEFPLQNAEIQAQTKDFFVKKYGFTHPLKHETIKTKLKQTNIKKYGVENTFQNAEIQAKMKETLMKNYGVTHPSYSSEIQDKTKQRFLDLFGVDNPLKNPEIQKKRKQTNVEKYGVEHVIQNAEIAERISKNGFKRKLITTPSGDHITLQGYEPFAYDLLLQTYKENEIICKRSEVPEIWWTDDTGKKHRYFIDFYLPHIKLMIEVKSPWTLKLAENQGKIIKTKQACEDAGFIYECWILDHKGKKIQTIC